MKLPIPDFISLPSSETMALMSVVLLIVGAFLLGMGAFLYFLRKKRGKKTTSSWVCMGIGALLLLNHGAQLLIKIVE